MRLRIRANALPGRMICPVVWSTSNGRGVSTPSGNNTSAAAIQATSGHALS